MKYLYETIAVSTIKRRAHYTLHPFLEPDHLSPELFASIATAGILTPPIVIPYKEIGYEVVCGRQRLRCLEELGRDSRCLCTILPQSAAPEEILTIILEDQAACSALSIIEQANFIALCDKLLPERKKSELFLAGLLKGRLGKGSRFLRPLSKLHPDIQRKIHYQVISEKVVGELQKRAPDEQQGFIALVEEFRIGGNRQKNLLNQLVDISRRENIPFSKVLDDIAAAGRGHNDMTGAQKLKYLLDTVEERHQPLYSQARASFTREVEKLDLPETCAVHASPAFERDEVTLTIRFDTLDQLKKDLPKIRLVADRS